MTFTSVIASKNENTRFGHQVVAHVTSSCCCDHPLHDDAWSGYWRLQGTWKWRVGCWSRDEFHDIRHETSAICCHQRNDIIRFLHAVNCKILPLKRTRLLADLITSNVSWPISTLLDQSCSKNSLRQKFGDAYDDTKTTIEHNDFCREMDWHWYPSEKPNCLVKIFKLWSPRSASPPASGCVFSLNELNTPYDPTDDTAVVFLSKGHGFNGTNIKPGQVYWFIQGDIDSTRQPTHAGVKLVGIFSFH